MTNLAELKKTKKLIQFLVVYEMNTSSVEIHQNNPLKIQVLLAAHVNCSGFRSCKVVWGTIRSDCIIVLSASVSYSVSIKKKKKPILCFVFQPHATAFLVVKYSMLLK